MSLGFLFTRVHSNWLFIMETMNRMVRMVRVVVCLRRVEAALVMVGSVTAGPEFSPPGDIHDLG